MRRAAGYAKWNDKRVEEIMEDLKTEPVLEYISKHKQNWRGHVNRMDRTRIPQKILQYAPRGRRPTGRPAKRRLETVRDHLV
jgi:hypothetical protein